MTNRRTDDRIQAMFTISLGGGVAGFFVGLIVGLAVQLFSSLRDEGATIPNPFFCASGFGILGLAWGLFLGLCDSRRVLESESDQTQTATKK